VVWCRLPHQSICLLVDLGASVTTPLVGPSTTEKFRQLHLPCLPFEASLLRLCHDRRMAWLPATFFPFPLLIGKSHRRLDPRACGGRRRWEPHGTLCRSRPVFVAARGVSCSSLFFLFFLGLIGSAGFLLSNSAECGQRRQSGEVPLDRRGKKSTSHSCARGMLVEMLGKVNFKNRNTLFPKWTSRCSAAPPARDGSELTAATHWFVR
jgi:hypothetical protein